MLDWAAWLDRGAPSLAFEVQSNGHLEVRQLAILALAQEMRRPRRENSITIFEHSEEGEKQSNHFAKGSVNIVKRLIRTLKSSTKSNLRTETGRLSH